MFALILIVVLFWFALSLLMAAGTLFLQGYFNETPPDPAELLWRAPAAAGGVAFFVLVWCIMAYSSPDRYAPLTEFSASEDRDPVPTLKAVVDGKTIDFRLVKGIRGTARYVEVRGQGRELPSRPEEVILTEDGTEAHFKPDRDANGKFKVERDKILRYRDETGRVMEEGYLGQLSVSHPGRTFVYVLLNLIHGCVWFACLWLLMRFTWGQALVLALGCWLAMTLLVIPPLWFQARDASRKHDREATQQGQNDKREDPTGPPSSLTSLRRTVRYLEATVAGNVMLTLVSSPARTAIRSVRLALLPSRTTSAVSV